MSNKNDVMHMVVRSGIAVPIEWDEAAKLVNGRRRPTGEETVEIPPSWKRRRVAFYPEPSPTPWPIGRPATAESPDAFRVADLERLLGPYLSGMVARAMKLREEELKKLDKRTLWGLILAGVASLFSLGSFIAILWLAREIGLL